MDATTKRILELAAEGLTDHEVANELNAEGLTNQKGQPWTAKAIYSRRGRSKGFQPTTAKPLETSDKTELSDASPLPEAWKREIIEIVRQEIQAMMKLPTVPKLPTESPDLPPMPSEKIKGDRGKPINPGKRTKIAGTVDAELERLFQEWRENKCKGTTLSRALDVVLWHFLGKPKLSFEAPETSEMSDEKADG
jgi:hypothetical protein